MSSKDKPSLNAKETEMVYWVVIPVTDLSKGERGLLGLKVGPVHVWQIEHIGLLLLSYGCSGI